MRRDQKAVARWVDRLLASDPDSSWALTVAARAYRALGQESQAIALYKRALDLSPEDVEVLRAQADLYAEAGKKEEQLKFLRQILAIRPQEKDVREYVEHIEPPKPRADEQYAWVPSDFSSSASSPGGPPPAHAARSHGDHRLSERARVALSSDRLSAAHRRSCRRGPRVRLWLPGRQRGRAAARCQVYRENGKVDEAIESGEGPADNPAIATYTSARTFYVHFPRLNAGDVVELRYRIEDVGQRNELSGYFGEIVYLQEPAPVYGAQYVLRTPKSRPFYFYASPLPGLSSQRDGRRRCSGVRLPSARSGASPPRAHDAPVRRNLGAHPRIDLQDLGRVARGTRGSRKIN